MKKALSRLSLSRETVRQLESADLIEVNGGISIMPCPTLTCNTCARTRCYAC